MNHVVQPDLYNQCSIYFSANSAYSVVKSKIKQNGYTIIELVIAILVASIVSTLVFGAYFTIYKEFKIHTGRADKVMETVVAKKRMDALFKGIKTISGSYKSTLEYSNYTDKENHTLSFRGNTLYIDNNSKVKGIKNFDYSISEKKSKTGKNLLLWETTLLNGYWIGGASEVALE